MVKKAEKKNKVITPKTKDGKDRPPLGMMLGTDQLVEGGLPRVKNKVAIVGFAPSSMLDAKTRFDDDDFEIWPLNQLYLPFPAMAERADRWFQIHHAHDYDAAVRDHKHGDWLKEWSQKTGRPLYMQERVPDIPTSIEYPVDYICNKYGRYFTNSISWMIVTAIEEGFKEMHIFGVDMAQDDEYANQRPSCEYFIGLARGAGIKVYIPDKSDLLKTLWLYPFEPESPMWVKCESRRKELNQRVQEMGANEQALRDNRNQCIGAMENMNYIQKAWGNTRRDAGLIKA